MDIDRNEPEIASDDLLQHTDNDEVVTRLQKLDPRSISLEQLTYWIVVAIALISVVVVLIVACRSCSGPTPSVSPWLSYSVWSLEP